MSLRSTRATLFGAVLTLAATHAVAQDDQAQPTPQANLEMGKMWTFENPPLDYLEAQYGFRPTADWLEKLRMASLRLDSGCSASFVSTKGLIMTNHHCVRDLIAEVQGENNWVEEGYVAASPDEEIKLEGVKAQQLVKMIDVTERMNAGIEDGDDAETIAEKREANEEKILEEAEKEHEGHEPQIVSLYQGAIYQLYVFKNYDDVRLVVAPHLQTAHFGGDPDNFTYPRYSIDFSFCRAWENGEPADTSAHYFRWSQTGPQEGELTFVVGNPGETNRLKTKAQLDYLRDVEVPIQLALIKLQLDAFRTIAERIPQARKQLEPTILGLENGEKAITGGLGGLRDDALMAQKERSEAAFRERIESDPELKARYGGIWDELAEVAEAKRTAFLHQHFYQELAPVGPLARGMLIARAVDANASSEERGAAADMARNFEQPRLNALVGPILAGHLDMAREWLGNDDPFVKGVLGDRDGMAVVQEWMGSSLHDRNTVNDLLEGGRDYVNQSTDPAMQAALLLYPLKSEAEDALEAIELREDALGAKVGRALHAAYGTLVSPDATFSLRFSDGVVEGYEFNGTIAPWRTSFYGLYARNTEFGNEYPFDLPQIWLDKKRDIDMTKGVDFVSTNDIIGGNSGSPIVNKDLEIVGLIFDGNIESLVNNYVFRGNKERSVSVHADAIMEALTKIYEAKHVADELTGAGQ